MARIEIPTHPASHTLEALRFVHSADLAPNGEDVAWCESHIHEDVELIELYFNERLLKGGARTSDPEFSPTGNRIAYLSAEPDAPPQIHVMHLDGSGESALTSFEQGVASKPRWSPDGRFIAFTASPPPRDPAKPFWVTRETPWRDGIGLVDDVANDVLIIDLESLKISRLTTLDSLIGSLEWHPDSTRLSFIATGLDGEVLLGGRICTVDLEGHVRIEASLPDLFAVKPGRDVLIGCTLGLGTTTTHGEIFTLKDGAVTVISGELDTTGDVIADIPVPFVDPDPRIVMHGNEVLARVHDRERIEIHRVPLSGASSSVLLATSGSVYPIAARNGVLLYAEGSRTSAPDLHLLDLETHNSQQVTHTAEQNAAVLKPVRVVDFTLIHDGVNIAATFMSAANTSGPQPTVLLIHGGPESAFGEAMFLDAHLLCEAGISVLMVNPRGSRGYGNEHLVASRGDWGGVDASDLMKALDEVIERGLADPDHLGVAGLSFGGYMTTWLVGHTDRFKAAVAENSVTSIMSLYGTSDIGTSFTPLMMNGPIDKAFEQYVKSSPVTYAERVSTPTLLIVSTEDHRCPPEQSLQFYHRVKSTGCTVEMVLLPGASHVGSTHGSPQVRRAQNDALLTWMTRYL